MERNKDKDTQEQMFIRASVYYIMLFGLHR